MIRCLNYSIDSDLSNQSYRVAVALGGEVYLRQNPIMKLCGGSGSRRFGPG